MSEFPLPAQVYDSATSRAAAVAYRESENTACPLIPMDDYIIAERCDSEDSLLVPAHLKKPSNKGRVIAVGPGRLLQSGEYAPLPLSVGDIVIFGGYLKESAGVDIDGTKYLICQAGDIIAKVRK